jgi:hypothetical protein
MRRLKRSLREIDGSLGRIEKKTIRKLDGKLS